jgi:hypothetical protein
MAHADRASVQLEIEGDAARLRFDDIHRDRGALAACKFG